jgi:hypothetical protein
VENEFKCADCGPGRWPYDDKHGCFDLDMQYMRWDSLLAIVPVCVSCGGILLTVTVISIFIRHSETPIVKVYNIGISNNNHPAHLELPESSIPFNESSQDHDAIH